MNTIHISKIEGDVPPDATHACINKKEEWLFYKKNDSGDILARWQLNDTWSIQYHDKLPDLKIIRDPLPETYYVPKVGDECEVTPDSGDSWCRCLTIGNRSDGRLLFEILDVGDDGIYNTGDIDSMARKAYEEGAFRPIQSEEDKTREWMNKVVIEGSRDIEDQLSNGMVIDLLIKAGVTMPESES